MKKIMAKYYETYYEKKILFSGVGQAKYYEKYYERML